MRTLKIVRVELKYSHNEEHFQSMSDTQDILEADFESGVGKLSANINTLFFDFKELIGREDTYQSIVKNE